MVSKKFDFVSSLVLILTSFYIVYGSVDIYQQAKEPLYLSPALVPLILGILLLLCSLVLLAESLKGSSSSQRWAEFRQWWGVVKKEEATKSMFIGTIIIGLYTYVLLPLLPFVVSTGIFLVVLMAYLKVGSWKKISILTFLTVAIIFGLFQGLFHVPLP